MVLYHTIHGLGRGLGSDLFTYHYNAPDAPWLAERVVQLIPDEIRVKLDYEWGLYHGTWSVLIQAFLDASVRVVQLSLDATRTFSKNARIGAYLEQLRREGVLIVASGNIVHTVKFMDWFEKSRP